MARYPDQLAANLRRIGLPRILFGTDWPVVTASDYISTLRTNLRLTAAEVDLQQPRSLFSCTRRPEF